MELILNYIYEITFGLGAIILLVSIFRLKYIIKSGLALWVVYLTFEVFSTEVFVPTATKIWGAENANLVINGLMRLLELVCILAFFKSLKPPVANSGLLFVLGTGLVGVWIFNILSLQNYPQTRQFVLGPVEITSIFTALFTVFLSLRALVAMYRANYYYPQMPTFWICVSLLFYQTFSLIISFPDAFAGTDAAKITLFSIFALVIIINYLLFAYAFWLTKPWIETGQSTLKY